MGSPVIVVQLIVLYGLCSQVTDKGEGRDLLQTGRTGIDKYDVAGLNFSPDHRSACLSDLPADLGFIDRSEKTHCDQLIGRVCILVSMLLEFPGNFEPPGKGIYSVHMMVSEIFG